MIDKLRPRLTVGQVRLVVFTVVVNVFVSVVILVLGLVAALWLSMAVRESGTARFGLGKREKVSLYRTYSGGSCFDCVYFINE